MSDKLGEYRTRAKELMKPIEDLMREAKREGYSLEVYTTMDIGGELCTRIAVLLR